MVKSKYIFPILGILVFNLLPALFLAPDLLYVSLLCLFTLILGFSLSNNIPSKNLIINLNNSLVLIFFILFIISEAFFGFNNFFSPFVQNVEMLLENHKKSERNIPELIRDIIRSFFLISTLLFSRKNKIIGLFLLIFYAFLVSSTSRSSFLIFSGLGLLNFTTIKFNYKTLSIVFILYIVFNYVSKLREDDKNAVLGNPIITAAAYPIISLNDLNNSEFRGSAFDYFIQLLIKPLPGFLFSPFGGKPIFSFNAVLTEELGSRLINDGTAISVYTSGAPFIFYKPLIIVVFIHVIIYLIIGVFFNYIKDYNVLFYYCGISVFFLHRSNLLDIISLIIFMYFSIFVLKKISLING